MAQRIIRNDFVAGEISPELWGRHDVDVYYHGAAKIENFIPRRTGGLRKRAGTEYLDRLVLDQNAVDFRAIPYKYDKDAFGILLIYRPTGEMALRWSMYSSVTGTHTAGASIGTAIVSIPASGNLSRIRYTQVGDTIYFTYPGVTAWKAAITFPQQGGTSPTIEWESLSTSIPVATPAVIAEKDYDDSGHSGFGEIDNEEYVSGTRQYCLWGVKNGVRSAPRYRTAHISLPWKSGAFVTIEFEPNWSEHDYYILGKLQGGQYGEVSRFYISSVGEADKVLSSFSDNSSTCRNIGGTGGVESSDYSAVASNSAGWIKWIPNDKTSGGRHRYGTFCHYVRANIEKEYQATYITGIKFWFGAKMSRSGTIYNVGCAERTTAVIWVRGDDDGPNETWTLKQVSRFTPGYNAGATTISFDAPVPAKGIRVYFYSDAYVDESDKGAAYFIPMRGMRVVCTGGNVCTFKDDNISPGTVVGEQKALTVGDTDMDVALIASWQQRLIAARSASLPFTMWFSAVGDLYNFYCDTPQTAANAFEATIASTEATRINHIIAQKWLLVFTEAGEYIINSTGGALAFNTIDIKQLSGVVAHDTIPPVTTESEVLFVAGDAHSVYKMDYTLERDAVVPTNLTIRAEHIAAARHIVAIAYQRFPDSVLWCLCEDGTLLSLTFCAEEDVCAWARHTLAGGDGLKVVDIFNTGSISSKDGLATTSEIVLVLTHEDAPGTVWFETFRNNVVVDSPSIDAASAGDGMGAAYCIDHMNYPTIARPGSVDPSGHVDARIETIRMESQQVDTIGMMSGQFDAVLRVLRSGQVSVRPITEPDGSSSAEWRKADIRPVIVDSTVRLVRGDVRIAPSVVHNREARFEIKSDDAYPCDILALCVSGNFGTMRDGG